MQTGRLRERVSLEEQNATQDAGGEPIPSWLPTAEMWAAIATAGSREAMRGDQLEATTTHTVTVRYREDIDRTKRFRWGSRILNITKAADPDNRRKWFKCECIEDVN